jgi:hypothetical protein
MQPNECMECKIKLVGTSILLLGFLVERIVGVSHVIVSVKGIAIVLRQWEIFQQSGRSGCQNTVSSRNGVLIQRQTYIRYELSAKGDKLVRMFICLSDCRLSGISTSRYERFWSPYLSQKIIGITRCYWVVEFLRARYARLDDR